MILRTLDPAELHFQMDSAGIVIDMETGRDVYVDPQAAAKDYAQRFEMHRAQLKAICDTLGVDLFEVATDRALQVSLFDILSAQQQRGRMITRHGGATSGSLSGASS